MRPSTKRPWILVVAYTDLPSDARLIRQAREACIRGARVTVLVPETDKSGLGLGLEDAEVVSLPTRQQRGSTTVLGQLRFMREIRRWARAQPTAPDVIHLHNVPDYVFWALRPLQIRGAKIVVDVRDIMSHLAQTRFRGIKRALSTPILRAMEQAVWRRADRLIAVHEPYRQQLLAAGIPSALIHVVLNTPDPEVFSPELRREPEAGRFKIVFHGTIADSTGILNAVRAMPFVLREVPNAWLLVIGAGKQVQAVRSLISDLALQQSVEFIDRYLPLPQVVELIADADAAVVPNERNAYTEHVLPVKLTEYAVLGIPAVATSLRPIEEYFGNRAALLIDEPTPEAIANGLIRLAKDPSLRLSLSSAGREFGQRHGWNVYRDSLASALGLDTVPLTQRAS